ncbi:MAG: L-seryl-tRNA(Sec) selenium transferase [Bacillales bacterium]|jgi:L-seryl-tRNA(Ser) seleniumtransferase|nr:L-seryl-tRNA(Sec) selenium transferase [Bacillales bacterium]
MNNLLRQLPPIHELQRNDAYEILKNKLKVGDELITNILKIEVDDLRKLILSKGNLDIDNIEKYLFEKVKHHLSRLLQPRLKRVINASGTVLHTNLGRSRLSDDAITRVVEVARNYSNLEYNLAEGKRGSRHSIIEEWVKLATGAEAAMVVNNNAAAVYLILRALAKDKEVIVSRGQLVEIGGSFRVSSIMEESGAKLKEIGTTNKTHISDYEAAITENTAMLLKVHTSNFKIIGFTKTVESDELVQLSNKHDNVIVYEDLGSGVLYDYKKDCIGDEPLVKSVLDQGVDIVSFSGDKLLGGPQAGIIAGKKHLIEKLKKNQLARVLRVDKMTLAALEATISAYVRGNEYAKSIPTVRNLVETKDVVHQKAMMMVDKLESTSRGYSTRIIEDVSEIGGGTMPGTTIPTYVVEVKHDVVSTSLIDKKLHENEVSIIGRIQNDKIIFDLRTVEIDEIQTIINALIKLEEQYDLSRK